jgi:aryl-phospho-beta-D-glucosidase BglC (GH1 family)
MEFLHTNGKLIETESHNVVFLRGTCVGGWMNMENFINGYPGTEISLREHMEKRLGKEKGALFFDEMISNFLSEEDIIFIKSTGATCIRLALNYRHFEDDEHPYTYKESGFKLLSHIIELCEKNQLYVILDMHAIQGWQNTHWHSDNDRGISLFWTDSCYQDRYYAMMQEFARRFRNCATIAGYELFNEPSSSCRSGDYPFNMYENFKSDYTRFNRIVRTAVEKIREFDEKHIIFIEGDSYGHNFSGLEAPMDSNLVYSSHDYIVPSFGPGKYPGHYDELHNDRIEKSSYWDFEKQLLHIKETEGWKFSEKYQVPLWVGEFGSQYCTGIEDNVYRLASMNDQLTAMNQLGLNWTTWTYKDCGTMGWVTLSSESEYLQKVAPVQKLKGLMAAENFTAWRGDCPGKDFTKSFTEYLMPLLSESKKYSFGTFQKCVNYALLTGFTAGVLQPEYTALFDDSSDEDIKRIMKSFSFEQCIVNSEYIEILRQHLSTP